jgi:tRNA-modifying protein YgfZ
VSGTDPALLQDYQALRRGLGARRLSHDVLSVTGPDAAEYLQGQCSQDLSGLGVGQGVDSLVLEPDGKLCALIRVVRTADDDFAVDVEGGYGQAVAERLARFRLRSKVTIEPLPWSCVALRGSEAAGAVSGDARSSGPTGGAPYRIPVRWNGTEGADLLGPGSENAVPANARWCGEGAWEALRVEAGIPSMGRELDGRTIAAEAGLVERTVSLTKGCYTGQELVARLDARGNRVARRLYGLVFQVPEGSEPPDATSLVGASVAVEGRDAPAGTVTSAAWSPALGAPVALAYLHRSVAVPGAVVLDPVSDAAWSHSLRAEARPLPLVGP